MIRTVDASTPSPVLSAAYTRRDNARAAAKRIFRDDEFRIEQTEGGKFRVVLVAGDEVPAPAPAPAADPVAIVQRIKDECGEVTVDNRVIPPKSASEKAAAKRAQMKLIAGGKAETPRLLDELGDLSNRGTGAEQDRVPAGQGVPLGELLAEDEAADGEPVELPAFLRNDSLMRSAQEPAEANEAPAAASPAPVVERAPKAARKPATKAPAKPETGRAIPKPTAAPATLTDEQEDAICKLYAKGARKGLCAKPERSSVALFPANMTRDLLNRFAGELSEAEAAAVRAVLATKDTGGKAANRTATANARGTKIGAVEGFGAALRNARKAAGLSIIEMAGKCGSPDNAIYRAEHGKYTPNADERTAWAKALGVEPSAIWGLAPPEPTPAVRRERATPAEDEAALKGYGTAAAIIDAIRKAKDGMSYKAMREAFGWKGVGLEKVVRAAERLEGVTLDYRFVTGPRDGRYFIAGDKAAS